MRRTANICLAFLSFSSCLLGSVNQLCYTDIRGYSEEMFSYHVEHKAFSPQIARRSIKIFIEQFDGEKQYLLKKEVLAFLEIDDWECERVIEQYHRDQFDKFRALNQLVQRSIHRARELRDYWSKQLAEEISKEIQTSGSIEASGDFAKSDEELSLRIRQELVYVLNRYSEGQEISLLSKAQREKILNFWEKKKRAYEKRHLPSDHAAFEHQLSLQILKSIARSLDAHTAFYSFDEAAEIRASLQKQFSGVGVVLKEGVDAPFVAEVVQGGPAERSKLIEPGDQLVGVNDTVVEGFAFHEIMQMLKGPDQSEVTLHLDRKDGDGKKRILVTLKRERIVMDNDRLTYEAEPYGNGLIGKIHLPTFYDSTDGISADKDLREAIRDLKSRGPLYGLIIDMRNNGGGFLSQAIKVAGMFISKGIVVVAKYANDEIQYTRDLDTKVYYQGPLVLVTSRASASATEIVAQSLKDYGAAVVVGDLRTYGKGSMQHQTITDSRARAYYKVTVGRYYTISGQSTQIKGVEADVVVPSILSVYNVGERYLQYPLCSDQLDLTPRASDTRNRRKSIDDLKKIFTLHSPKKETHYTRMIPHLKANSAHRIGRDPNHQEFAKKLSWIQKQQAKSKSEQSSELYMDRHGRVDLQMHEAVNIIKDMVVL